MSSDQSSMADILLAFLANNLGWYTPQEIAARLGQPTKARQIAFTLNVLRLSNDVDGRVGKSAQGGHCEQYSIAARQAQKNVISLNKGLLRRARQAAGITIEDVAAALNKQPRTIQMLEIRDISKFRLETLIKYLGPVNITCCFAINSADGRKITDDLLCMLRQEKGLSLRAAAKLRRVTSASLACYERPPVARHSLLSLDSYLSQVFGLRLFASVGSNRIILPEPPRARQ